MTAGEMTVAAKPTTAASARLAGAGWLALIAMCAVALVIQLSTGSAWIPDAYGFPGFTSLFAVSCGTVGAVVVARRPSNLVGRVLLAAGLIAGFQSLYTEYAVAAYLGPQGPQALPLASIAAWLLSWAWLPFVFLAGPMLLLVFPDGHLLSPRWRIVLVAVAVDAALFAALAAFRSGPLENFAVLQNPFGVLPVDAIKGVFGPVAGGMALGFVLSAFSVLVRYRRSDAERRQQLKWIVAAGALGAVAAPLGFSGTKFGQLLFIGAICLIPVATGIAILRYRLYEIDTIINRALVYGLLTAIVAGIYTASIGVMQRLSNAFLGGNSEATIVVTTVLIVTAFTPIKTRLQAFVDRRFKDAGDAKTTFEAFTRTVHERTWALDAEQVVRRFAETAAVALRGVSAEVSLETSPRPIVTSTAQGEGEAGPSWSVASTAGPATLRLRVVLGGRPMTPRDEAAAADAVRILAAELADS